MIVRKKEDERLLKDYKQLNEQLNAELHRYRQRQINFK